MSLFYILTIGFSAVSQEWGAAPMLSAGYRPNIFITVNRADFGQIFTIFINIFTMMKSILGFIWGLVCTM